MDRQAKRVKHVLSHKDRHAKRVRKDRKPKTVKPVLVAERQTNKE
jgi:hypothetical protein